MTLKELHAMAEARAIHDWDQTAAVLCMVHNVNCAKKSQKIDVAEVHPYLEKKRRGVRITKDTVGSLKALSTVRH